MLKIEREEKKSTLAIRESAHLKLHIKSYTSQFACHQIYRIPTALYSCYSLHTHACPHVGNPSSKVATAWHSWGNGLEAASDKNKQAH
jgi:hypothetical protein